MGAERAAGAAGAARPDERRVRLAFALTTTMALTTVMQFTIGALGPTLSHDLGISRAALGVMSAVYYLAGAALSLPLGRWIDSVQARVALRAAFTASALGLVVLAAIASYPLVLLAMIPAGVAAAAGNPVTNRVIAALPSGHGLIVGIKQSGVQLGALGAGAILPALATAIGWREALLCVAGACLLALTTTTWIPRGLGARPDPGEESPVGVIGAVGGVRTMAVYAFCMGAGMSTITTYLPLYGHGRLGMSVTEAGALVSVVGLTGVVSRLSWSRVAERRHAAGRPPTLLIGFGVVALAATVVVALAAALGTWALWLGAALFGMSAVAWNAIAMFLIVVRSPPETTARASGVIVTTFYLGLCVSAPAFGALVDATGTYTTGWALTALSFAAATAVAVVLMRAFRYD